MRHWFTSNGVFAVATRHFCRQEHLCRHKARCLALRCGDAFMFILIMHFRCGNSTVFIKPLHPSRCIRVTSGNQDANIHIAPASISLHPDSLDGNIHVATASISCCIHFRASHPDFHEANIHVTIASICLHQDTQEPNIHVATATISLHPENQDANIHVATASDSWHPGNQGATIHVITAPISLHQGSWARNARIMPPATEGHVSWRCPVQWQSPQRCCFCWPELVRFWALAHTRRQYIFFNFSLSTFHGRKLIACTRHCSRTIPPCQNHTMRYPHAS